MSTNHNQKFRRGDIVHIAADLGASMRHFRADADAISQRHLAFQNYVYIHTAILPKTELAA